MKAKKQFVVNGAKELDYMCCDYCGGLVDVGIRHIDKMSDRGSNMHQKFYFIVNISWLSRTANPTLGGSYHTRESRKTCACRDCLPFVQQSYMASTLPDRRMQTKARVGWIPTTKDDYPPNLDVKPFNTLGYEDCIG